MAAPLPLLLPLLPPLLLLLLLLLTGPTPSVDADVVDRTGCNRTVDAGDLLTHPQLTAANKGRPYNCWFLVGPPFFFLLLLLLLSLLLFAPFDRKFLVRPPPFTCFASVFVAVSFTVNSILYDRFTRRSVLFCFSFFSFDF